MIYYGIISEVKEAKARVALGELTTDFLPVIQLASSFKRSWTPIREKEQCIILAPGGNVNTGVIIRGIYYDAYPAPLTDKHKESVIFSDGTNISYDVDSKLLSVDASLNINIKANGKISVECEEAEVKCKDVNITSDKAKVTANSSAVIDSPLVELGGEGGSGVVTAECYCSLTGLAHPESSMTVKAIKLK